MAPQKMEKGLRQSDTAFNLQEQARDQAEEEARRIAWRLLQEARSQYIDWQEFCFWAGSVMETEHSVTPWLAAEIADSCPSFVEEDSRYSAEHADEGFLSLSGSAFGLMTMCLLLPGRAAGSMRSLITRFATRAISARMYAGLNLWNAGTREDPSDIPS